MSTEYPFIARDIYFSRVKPYIGKNIIKVFTGQRRVGKSYLQRQIMTEISKLDANTKVIYIDKEQFAFEFIKNAKDLFDYIESQKTEKNALFIDEVQEIEEFEKVLRSYYNDPAFDIYITGSNANLLSGELATLLSGRNIEIAVHPLSYKEFLLFHKLENTDDIFLKYLQFGGMPNLIHINLEEDIVQEYLVNIYHSILLQDVVKRNNIRNVSFLEKLVEYLADNVGSLVSAKKISDFLKSQKISITPNTVLDYIKYLEGSYCVNMVRREEIFGQKIFEVSEKYFFEDLGLRNAIVGYKFSDIGKILENVVYNHLVIAGYKVTIGVNGQYEIDFIAKKAGEIIYVQVCYLLQDEKTINREFGNLLIINDQYPKYVVSMDANFGKNTYKGIHHKSVKDFCFEIA